MFTYLGDILCTLSTMFTYFRCPAITIRMTALRRGDVSRFSVLFSCEEYGEKKNVHKPQFFKIIITKALKEGNSDTHAPPPPSSPLVLPYLSVEIDSPLAERNTYPYWHVLNKTRLPVGSGKRHGVERDYPSCTHIHHNSFSTYIYNQTTNI